ncbi:carbohydrate-binding protein [Thalassoroseus pseudoceratinae]|uniref:carbohydrate-binding protein n=1 Tax=Thalassoroseus pseudoceratinae TaxID=2713176 RepID=UPI001422DF78|nr:carbohydrate-binding protein [Thalassoroseus pseudoceratinae]
MTIEEGDDLHVGRYLLEEGVAKLLFPWGTEVALEAPAEFEFCEDGSKFLRNGQLVAKVSAEDSGFTIDTPAIRLIDLGTEFGLSTNSQGESEVHVFKGSVEVRPRFVEASSDQSSITLGTGQANGFDMVGPIVRSIAFNPKRFSKAWQLNNRIAQTTGGMRFTHPAPSSVAEGETESSETQLLFAERQHTLNQPLAVTFTEPGLYTTFNDRISWLPEGLHVESYLVHFDPVGSTNNQSPVTVEGSVTFDRPIIAVIARGDQLSQSDPWLASPRTEYLPKPNFRQLEGDDFSANITPAYGMRGMTGLWNIHYTHESPAPNDWVRLSSDRKTLTVRSTAGGESDQLRVLVSDDEAVNTLPAYTETRRLSKPFQGRPFTVGEKIEAEDFDLGGQDVAYYDTTADSLSNVYRRNESVELKQYVFKEETHTNVSVVRAGEWLTYTINIEEPGRYTVSARAGSKLKGGKFRFEIGEPGAPFVVTSSFDMPQAPLEEAKFEDWYGTVQSEPILLPAGRQVLRIVMEANHSSGRLGNFDWFRIDRVSPPGISDEDN